MNLLMKQLNLFQVIFDKTTKFNKVLNSLIFTFSLVFGMSIRQFQELIMFPTYSNLYLIFSYLGLDTLILIFIYQIFDKNN